MLVDDVVQGVGQYGTPGVVGSTGQTFTADNSTTYQITVRGRVQLNCAASLTTLPVMPLAPVVPSLSNRCGLVVEQFEQSVCFDNATTSPADDYFRITLRVVSNQRGPDDWYEVVTNGNPDGTGGTVLNGQGTRLGDVVVLSRNQLLKADGVTTLPLLIRNKSKPTCYVLVRTRPVQSCSQ